MICGNEPYQGSDRRTILNLASVTNVPKESIAQQVKTQLFNGAPSEQQFFKDFLSLSSGKFLQLMNFDYAKSHGPVVEEGLQLHEMASPPSTQPLTTIPAILGVARLLCQFNRLLFGPPFDLIIDAFFVPFERIAQDYSPKVVNDVIVGVLQRHRLNSPLVPAGHLGLAVHMADLVKLYDLRVTSPNSPIRQLLVATHNSYLLKESQSLLARQEADSIKHQREIKELRELKANNSEKRDRDAVRGQDRDDPKQKREKKQAVIIDLAPLENFCTTTFLGVTCKKLAKGECISRVSGPLKHIDEFNALDVPKQNQLKAAYKKIAAARLKQVAGK